MEDKRMNIMMCYDNTGKGGRFFRNLYEDVYSFDDIRDTPCSVDEFRNGGLSDADISEYFSLIKHLYGELFLVNNQLLPVGVHTEAEAIWQQLYDFCLSHSLICEFADTNGNTMKLDLPVDVKFFFFVFQDERCPGIIHIDSLDDFRLVVEVALAGLSCDWYLSLRYNIYTIYNQEELDDFEYYGKLYRYDSYAKKMIILPECESLFLLDQIRQDLNQCENRIEQHDRTFPNPNSLPLIGRRGAYRDWCKKYNNLQKEKDYLIECEEVVSNIIDSGVHTNIHISYPDDTLYVHKGRIKCEREKHRIEQVTAMLLDKYGKDIELNVCHCLDCDKFFIHYDIYNHYRQRYGTILGNIHMARNGEFTAIGYDLADESPLRLCGYSVSQKDNLSQWERQTIIASCIESGAMEKSAVIRLLNWFVNVNGNKTGNEEAQKKWCDDLEFALAYNTSNQSKYQIGKIIRYSRNRFVHKE